LIAVLGKVLRDNFNEDELSQLQFLFINPVFWRAVEAIDTVSSVFSARAQRDILRLSAADDLREAAKTLLSGVGTSVTVKAADC
jgi:hypothetical protein